MDEPGQKLKQARERLGLRYRDIEEFTQQLADKHKNSEFIVTISRLSDIENRGVVPTIFKLYALCAIYRLEMAEVMRWYGVELDQLAADSTVVSPVRTHLVGFGQEPLGRIRSGEVQVPLSLDPGLDMTKTTFLTRFIQSWGVLPLMLVAGLDLKNQRYGFVGLDDWFMFPMIQPGSLLLIDETRRKVVTSGWSSEHDRPIYLLEHREGWMCAWCSITGDTLIAHPHPASSCVPVVFPYPSGVDVVGQVIGVACRLETPVRRRTRS